ncbi:hypothetical protein MSP8887_01175 [Marinomonas spartinae]|uniref:Uncharacterized protein n=1 Tax=Marinomonas spartinae TaxID=1792290 RepID=A0A1A8T577_9GAMM|nr:hypothetical protein [Marinomonas spartinae]SBS27479.1 hypothetical protein MSP8886_00862 [Marinomonas spartinae]SBS29855.1 hypothetical protein MSP8887_01175 [Marinomonas spartinae]
MYTKEINKFSILILFLLFSQTIYAECNAKFGDVKHLYDDFESYDSQQHSDARKRLGITVINSNDCHPLHIILTTENQSQLKGQYQIVPYQIRSNIQQIVSSSMTRLNLINSYSEIELFIRSGTPIKAGVYSDRLKLKLYNENNQLLDNQEFEIEETILPKTSLSMLGYNSSIGEINLGELVSGKEYNMLPTLKVVTNSNIEMRIISENHGRLVHNTYKNKYAINYFLYLDGEWMDLHQDKRRVFSYQDKNTFLLKLSVRLANFTRQAAGEYSDTIRFQISPLNY